MRILILALALAACTGDETLTAYGAGGSVWHLSELDGAPAAMPARLQFPEPGQMTGHGPCNSFRAAQTAPYPWFETGPIAATRRACPHLAAEQAFLAALREMELAEVLQDTLILSNGAGRQMVFKSGG